MAQERSGVSGLAGRYAKALFDLALESDALDATAHDLARVREMLDASADLRRMARSPLVPRARQGAAVAALARRAGLGAAVAGFLGVLARNRRLFALAEAIDAFDSLLARHRGEVDAEVVSARPLDSVRADAIARAVAGAVGGAVRIRTATDASLIGGFVVRVGSRMVDASVRGRLRALEAAMKGAA